MAAATRSTVNEAQKSLLPTQLPKSKARGHVPKTEEAALRLEKTMAHLSLDSDAPPVTKRTERKRKQPEERERRTSLNKNGLRLSLDFGKPRFPTDSRRPTV